MMQKTLLKEQKNVYGVVNKMNRVIISGVSGFIGNAVARKLNAGGVEVIGVTRSDINESNELFRIQNLDIEIIQCDLNEMGQLPLKIGKRGFDVFYQFAWDGLTPETLNDYKLQLDNVNWTIDTICAASELQCKKVVGAGSITQTELYTKKGRNYIADKHKYFRVAQLASETVGRVIAREKGIEIIWPIIINVYGEGETNPRLINSLIMNMVKGLPFPLSSGEQIYDFIHIDDAAEAFCLIGKYGRPESQYIISSGAPRRLRDYIIQLRDIVSPDYHLEFSSQKFSGYEIDKTWMDITELKNDTGFEPKVSFEEGVRRILDRIGE